MLWQFYPCWSCSHASMQDIHIVIVHPTPLVVLCCNWTQADSQYIPNALFYNFRCLANCDYLGPNLSEVHCIDNYLCFQNHNFQLNYHSCQFHAIQHHQTKMYHIHTKCRHKHVHMKYLMLLWMLWFFVSSRMFQEYKPNYEF